MADEVWAKGDAYEAYVGRWSRLVAAEFVRWLGVPPGRRWLDVGCGTGALTATVLAGAEPSEVVGVDPSEGFLATARTRIDDPRATFHTGDARSLPLPDQRFDAVVSGLALNFVPDPARAVAEFARVAAPGAVVAAYVWDYAEGMGMIRELWDAAFTLNPAAAELDEARRFTICAAEPLRDLWEGSGLGSVSTQLIEISTRFDDFQDFWEPFLGGQGPAGSYVVALPDQDRDALRELLRSRLDSPDGSIVLPAKAWAVRGTKPS